MFGQRLNELRQRQLEIRLRNAELRAELATATNELTRPFAWLQGWGGLVGAAGMLAGMRRSKGLRMFAWGKLALRMLRLWFFSASSTKASEAPEPSVPPPASPPSP